MARMVTIIHGLEAVLGGNIELHTVNIVLAI